MTGSRWLRTYASHAGFELGTRSSNKNWPPTCAARHGAVRYDDSVGVGSYRIDLHPTTSGNTYVDVASAPFEIPLGALVPVRMRNLLPACKNIGTTHITNGCYRLHPVEWNIGEVAGLVAAYCLRAGTEPHALNAGSAGLGELVRMIENDGVQRRWPEGHEA